MGYLAAGALAACGLSCATTVMASIPPETSPPIIVVLPPVTWSEVRSADMPNTHALLEGGAIALMPIASPSDADPNRTWVALGAGRGAAGGQITGSALPGGGFQVDIGPLRAANDRAHIGAAPGFLGSRLRERGLTTTLIAYSASQPSQVPPSAALIMDEDGRINGGRIYQAPQLAPRGEQLDPAQVHAALIANLSPRGLALLDLSPMTSLSNADAVIGAVSAEAESRGRMIWLMSALAPAFAEKGHRVMGFIVARRPASAQRAELLTTRSTRWPGVVTPSDFAPMLLHVGLAMDVTQSPDPLRHLDRLDRILTEQFALEGAAARLYTSYMMLLAAATVGLGWLKRNGLRRLAAPALMGVLLPIGLLVCPLAGLGQTRQLIAACATAVLAALAISRLRDAAAALALALSAASAVICADAVTGWHLMRAAPLGLGAVTGIRFYGIGNEYAAVLAAALPIQLGLMLHSRPSGRWAAAFVGAAVAFVVGAPWWGANWGGYVAIAAGLLALWVFSAPQQRARRAAPALIALLLLSALPGVLDLLRPEADRTHIGAAAMALIQGRGGTLRDTALRKIEMNWRLVRLASWWWVLAPVGLLGIWELIRRGRETWPGVGLSPSTRAGFLGALVAAFVGMAVNDSGIVMLGMSLAVTFSAFVFLVARREAGTA